MTKANPDYVYDKDGKPLTMGGKPIRQSMYDEFSSPGFLEKLRGIASDHAAGQVIKEAMKKR